MSGFDVYLLCPIWDFEDEGIESALDRVHGELGATGISVPVVSPAMSVLRARATNGPRLLETAGGLQFQPDDACYAATRCDPVVDRRLRSRNPLQAIGEACEKVGLQCRAVVHCSTPGEIAARNPKAAAKTVDGHPWSHRLCLVNPDVQAFYVALCRDLVTNYPIAGIELADLSVGRTQPLRKLVDIAPPASTAAERLLAICFCESCRQLGRLDPHSAHVDAEAAARSAEVLLSRSLNEAASETAAPDSEPDPLTTDPVLGDYVRAQQAATHRLVAAIKQECPCDVAVRLYRDDLIPTSTAPEGADAVVGTVDPEGGQPPEQTADRLRETTPPGVRTEFFLPAFGIGGAAPVDGPDLVRIVTRFTELGLDAVTLESLGTLPQNRLPSVRQAIRFARRRRPASED